MQVGLYPNLPLTDGDTNLADNDTSLADNDARGIGEQQQCV